MIYDTDGKPLLDERFWSKVNKTEMCWLWTASRDLKGYGQFGIGGSGRTGLAHRLSFAAEYGPIPPKAHVLHACDHPACVRPEHLRLGTHQENIADMTKKGRAGQKGERSHRTRLNPMAILVIRFLAARGVPYGRLCRAYGLSAFGLCCITRGLTWRHLPGPFTFYRRGSRQRTVLRELPNNK